MTRVKRISVKNPLYVGMSCKTYGNKVEIKTHKKTNLIQEDGIEERQKSTLHLFHALDGEWNGYR